MSTAPLSDLQQQRQKIKNQMVDNFDKFKQEMSTYGDELASRTTLFPSGEASKQEKDLWSEFMAATKATIESARDIVDTDAERTEGEILSRVRFAAVDERTMQALRDPRLQNVVAIQMKHNELYEQLHAMDGEV